MTTETRRRPDPADTLDGAVRLMLRDQADAGASYDEAVDEVVRLLAVAAGMLIGARAGGDRLTLERGLYMASKRADGAARRMARRAAKRQEADW